MLRSLNYNLLLTKDIKILNILIFHDTICNYAFKSKKEDGVWIFN